MADNRRQQCTNIENHELYVPDQFTCDDVAFPGVVVRKDLKEAMLNFECRNDDVFIVTYPRSGTTWTIELISLILNDVDVEHNETVMQYVRTPYLEMCVKNMKRFQWFILQFSKLKNWLPLAFQRYFKIENVEESAIHAAMDAVEYLNLLPSSTPRMVKTHMQHKLFPPKAFEKRSKIICVARNPKDTLVSFYHLHRCNYLLGSYSGTWNEFYNLAMKKQLIYGDWFDHVLGWWKYKDKENVYFLKYEDMKKDLRGVIKKLAKFLNKDLTDDKINQIEIYCSFDNMKINPGVNMERDPSFNFKRAEFIRKGVIGDWQNYFTVAQNTEFEELYKTKMKDSGLSFQW
ncbi:sulfotransferase 1C4-like [Glandiceps talaboti]